MSMSTPFIRRPVATSLLTAALVLVGLAAYPFLPVAPLPRVEFPTIAVSASYPGASPEIMAATVAQPLERQFAQIPGVAQLTSVNVLGQSSITLQFDLDRDIDAAAGDVQAAINAASGQLPKNLPSSPTYRKVSPVRLPILILAVSSDEMPLIAVDTTPISCCRSKCSQIAGVSQVLIGGEAKAVPCEVQVDPRQACQHGPDPEDVRSVLVNATVDAPKGTVYTHIRRSPSTTTISSRRPQST
jgi:multidrug efflux pump subunit AcrB